MIILVLGGSGSGKSAFAEHVACSLSDSLLYVATMQPFGDEAKARIHRHVQMRKEKGFLSIDCYTNLESITYKKPYGAVLLECMSNLLANEIYAEKASGSVVEKIIDSVNFTALQTENLVIVSNDVGFDVNDYSAETMDYIKKLGCINCQLSAVADTVIEVVCGIPIYRKGDGHKKW